MKKIERGSLSKFQIYTHTLIHTDSNVDQCSGSNTVQHTIQMAKDSFIEDFNKLRYNGDRIVLHMDSGKHVSFWIERDYSATCELDSKTYTQFLATDCNGRCIKSKKTNHKNPEYDGNPDCQFCNKRVIKVVPEEDAKGKVLMVCVKCRKKLKHVVEFSKQWDKTHSN